MRRIIIRPLKVEMIRNRLLLDSIAGNIIEVRQATDQEIDNYIQSTYEKFNNVIEVRMDDSTLYNWVMVYLRKYNHVERLNE